MSNEEKEIKQEEIKEEEAKEESGTLHEISEEEDFLSVFEQCLIFIMPFLPLRLASYLNELPEAYIENDIYENCLKIPFDNWTVVDYANLAYISINTKDQTLKEKIDDLLRSFRKYVLVVVEKMIELLTSEEEVDYGRGN